MCYTCKERKILHYMYIIYAKGPLGKVNVISFEPTKVCTLGYKMTDNENSFQEEQRTYGKVCEFLCLILLSQI
jgi:hypothetical protein